MFGTAIDAVAAAVGETGGALVAVDDGAADPVSFACKPYRRNLEPSSEDPCESESACEYVWV